MGILAKFIPFIVFITTMEMVFHTDAVTFWAMGKLVLGETFLILLVLLFFALVMALYGKMSPKIFLRKVLAFAPVPLALRSSNAALPQTLKLVTDSFGVSKSLASFALPVGTQLHQAGSCIFLALSVMMTARVFDKTFTPEFVLSMALYVFVFAYTMPPVPGGGIIALSSVFTAIGVPTEAVMVFLCVEPILDMGDTMANVSCNVTSSLLLAKKFDMLDEEIYKTE